MTITPRSRNSITLWIVTAATLWAAIVRFIRLDSLAPAAWYDEVWFALRARELLHGAPLQVFYITTFGGANAGLVYLTALVQALGIDGITSARWVLAAAGVISIPAAYQCFRQLAQNRAIGVLAAVFLAYTMFVVIITRVGMESGMAPVVALLVVWQVLRGARGHRSGWVIAGLALGLAQYNGLHARFVIPVAAYLLLDLLITSRERRGIALGGLTMLGISALAAASLIAFFMREPHWLTARAGFVAGTGFERYITNIAQIARVFTLEGSYDPKTTVPGVPLFDVIQSIGFFAGLAWCALNLHRRTAARLLIVWLVVASLPGVLTDGPNLQRMIGIAAPLAGIVAVGWVGVIVIVERLFIHKEHKKTQRTAAIFSVSQKLRSNYFLRGSTVVAVTGTMLLMLSVAWHAHLVFVRWPQEPKLGAQFTAAPVDMAREALGASGVVFAERIPDTEDVIAWEYLFAGTDVTRLDLRKCLPMPHQRSTPTSFLILTEGDAETSVRLREAYPGAWFKHRGVDLWQETADWIEVPAGVDAPAPRFKVSAEFDEGISLYGYDWSSYTVSPGETLFLTLYWHATEQVSEDLTAFAHVGTGLEGTSIIAQRDGQPCIGLYPTSMWQPGEVVPDSFAVTIPDDASPGEYPIAVGWYRFPSLERVALIEADNALADGRAVIGTIQVVEP
jgi:hypothetical protein